MSPTYLRHLKAAKLLATFIYPYQGQSLDEFWRLLSSAEKFLLFHRISRLEGILNVQD